jgi:hypothetical protein
MVFITADGKLYESIHNLLLPQVATDLRSGMLLPRRVTSTSDLACSGNPSLSSSCVDFDDFSHVLLS